MPRPSATVPELLALAPFSVVRERAAAFPPKQRRLAQALVGRPEEFAFGSIREVARKVGVNAATISRFAQALGYGGYAELQTAVRDAYLAHVGLPAPSEGRRGGELEMLRARHQANLAQVYDGNPVEAVDRAADALVEARRVLVTGESVSAILAGLFARLLLQVGVKAEAIPASGVDRTVALSGAGPGDVVVGLGLWLTFRPAVDTLAAARRLGARTIVIAGSATNPLARTADIALVAPAQGQAISFSVVATVSLMEMVVARIVARYPERAREVEQLLHDTYLAEDMVAPVVDPEAS